MDRPLPICAQPCEAFAECMIDWVSSQTQSCLEMESLTMPHRNSDD